MAFGVGSHLFDFILRQTRRAGDRNFLFLAGRLVLRRDIQNAVGIDVKRHFDLRDAARSGRDAH